MPSQWQRKIGPSSTIHPLFLLPLDAICAWRESAAINVLVTSLALHQTPNSRVSSLFRDDPFADHPWWIVPNMESVAAVQTRGPMHMFILIKADHAPLHRTPPCNIQ